MNDVFFVCRQCKELVDAGYRWAYVNLETTGIVSRGQAFKAKALLECNAYWSPPAGESSAWLTNDRLPQVAEFIHRHRGHELYYYDLNDFPDDFYLEWLDRSSNPIPTPRLFVERLGYTAWPDILQAIFEAPEQRIPWRWNDKAAEAEFRRVCEELIERQR